MATIDTRTCRFPGCGGPAEAGDERAGQPRDYCTDPAHHRASAWRARRTLVATTAGRQIPDDLGRPVTMASARASAYTAQLTGQVNQLSTTLTNVLEQLRTLSDPDAAAVQIEAITADAEQRVAGEQSRAARAEQARRTAEQERAEADAAAEDALAAAASLTQQLAQIRQEHNQITEELRQAREGHATDLARLNAELGQAHDAVHALSGRAAAAAEKDAATAQRRTDDLTAELDRTRADIAAARGELERVRTAADAQREQILTLSTEHATQAAYLAAALERLEDERTHTDTRLADQKTAYEERLAELRTELGRPRD